MARLRFITVLVLLVAAAVPAAGASVGIIPLQLTDAETSYLGIYLLPRCSGPGRPMQDARLPVTNDGSNLAAWGASIPLQALSAKKVGAYTEVRVTPSAFNLAGLQSWTDACGEFTYVVRLNHNVVQPQSLIYLAGDASFEGTLYVAAVLRMTDLATGVVSEQRLSLVLNVDGKWLDEPATRLLDGDLSTLLPFTERGSGGEISNEYTCATESHPMGYYCLQASADLLAALDNR